MSDAECEAEPSTAMPGQEEYDPEGECRARKKRAAPKQREWNAFGRWDRSKLSDKGINKKICNILNDVNQDACLGAIRGSHKDRKSFYCDFQSRREWFSRGGFIKKRVVSCPMRDRSGCQCESKIVKETTTVVLLIANAHTTQDHEEESIKYLSHTTHKQKWL
jgi:hypothetical protein